MCLQVACTGKEERLVECAFPENFGEDGTGVTAPDCMGTEEHLAVVCRRFEITGVP